MQTPKLNHAIATTGDGRDITKGFFKGLQQPSDRILQNRGGADLKIYEEVLSDWQVKSCWGDRQRAVISKEWVVEPGGERRVDKAAAAHIEQQLRRIGWDRVTQLMLFGVFYGHAVAEVIYGRDDRYITLDAIKVRNRRRFRYDQDGGLRLLTPQNMLEGEPCAAPYFWNFCTGADNDDEPYGLGLAHWLYWPVWFKRNGIKFWLTFLEKFGMPTVKGEFDPNSHDKAAQNRLLEACHAVQSDSGIILPKGMAIDLMEAGRSGTADYKALHDTMDAAIAKVTVGQTASSQGTPGRLGGDDLQGEVRQDLIKADADLICESFNLGPVTWLTRWNFPDAELPRVFRQVEASEDMESRAKRDQVVFAMSGFKPTLAYLQKTYDVEVQEPTEPAPTEFAEQAPQPATTAADQLDDQLQPHTAQWIARIRQLTEQATTLDELRELLISAMPDMDLEGYADAMAQALAAAALQGRVEILEEAARGR